MRMVSQSPGVTVTPQRKDPPIHKPASSSSSRVLAGSRRPGAAFWRARVAFEGVEVVFCQKRAVLFPWCTDWSCQKNAGQLTQKGYVFL